MRFGFLALYFINAWRGFHTSDILKHSVLNPWVPWKFYLILMLHKLLIFSTLECGCKVYSSATDAKLSMLDFLHHAGVRLATGAFRIFPVSSLLANAGVLSPDQHRQLLMQRCWAWVHSFRDSVSCPIVLQDFHSSLCVAHPSLLSPFWYRIVGLLMSDLSVPALSVCSYGIPKLVTSSSTSSAQPS